MARYLARSESGSYYRISEMTLLIALRWRSKIRALRWEGLVEYVAPGAKLQGRAQLFSRMPVKLDAWDIHTAVGSLAGRLTRLRSLAIMLRSLEQVCSLSRTVG
jgi:hypothetical protein